MRRRRESIRTQFKTVGSDKYEEAKATLESFWKEAKAVFEKN